MDLTQRGFAGLVAAPGGLAPAATLYGANKKPKMVRWLFRLSSAASDWLLRRRERDAIRVLMKSNNITMLAFKDRASPQIFMAAAPSDPAAFTFYARNMSEVEEDLDPDSLTLERIFHSPDATKD